MMTMHVPTPHPRPILQVNDLVKTYHVGGLLSRRPPVQAVSGVSFEIAPGETLALVGESGCGKSTISRVVLSLTEATAGNVVFDGRDIATMSPAETRAMRQQLQMVFQDPFGSLNPRKTVRQIVSQPLRVAGVADWRERAADLLHMVGMTPPERFLDRMPHEFSGGQRQRIAIARAFALSPRLVVADEAVSALDVSVRAQILMLMKRLQQETHVSYLFITHDLGVVRSVADRVAVMYLGRLVETGPVEAIFRNPAHPYTRALLSASPVPDPDRSRIRDRILLQGDIPSPSRPPPGCRFHTRCPLVQDRCRVEAPALLAGADGRLLACHDAGAQSAAAAG